MPRRPSLVVTQSSEADLLETTTNSYNSNNNNALRLPDMSITPPTTPNNTHSSFLQAPSFLKVCNDFFSSILMVEFCVLCSITEPEYFHGTTLSKNGTNGGTFTLN